MIVAWNIPGAISPRLQKIAEDAVSALLAEVPDLLQEQGERGEIKYPSSSKFGCGMTEFSACTMSGRQEASWTHHRAFNKLMLIRNPAQRRCAGTTPPQLCNSFRHSSLCFAFSPRSTTLSSPTNICKWNKFGGDSPERKWTGLDFGIPYCLRFASHSQSFDSYPIIPSPRGLTRQRVLSAEIGSCMPISGTSNMG